MNQEEQVTDAFSDVSDLLAITYFNRFNRGVVVKATDALVTALNDLEDKVNDLNEFDQGNDIETALGDLLKAYDVSP